MKWDTDIIISIGLIAVLILFVIGNFIVILFGQQPLEINFASNVASGLLGYMSKGLIERARRFYHDNFEPESFDGTTNSASQGNSDKK